MLDVKIRNEYLIQFEPVVKWTIKQNLILIQALCLDMDDVYQDLCIAAIKAIDAFDPEKSNSIKTHIISRLQYEIKNLKRRYKPHGLTGARRADIVFCSLNYQPEAFRNLEIPVDALYHLVEFNDALSLLTPAEKQVFKEKAQGTYHRKKEQRVLLTTALDKLSQYYERSVAACY